MSVLNHDSYKSFPYEKDDRQNIHDRRNYVLGWDNRSKIEALKADYQFQSQQCQARKQKIQQIEQKKMQREQWDRLINEFLEFDDFNEIDWESVQNTINEHSFEKDKLLNSSNQLKELEQQKKIDNQAKSINRTLTQIAVLIQTIDDNIDKYQKELSTAKNNLTDNSDNLIQEYINSINIHIKERNIQLTVRNIEASLINMQQYYNSSIARITGNINNLRDKLVQQILEYKNAYQMETKDIDSSERSLPELRQMLQTIIQEDLPRHAERFKSMLNDTVITHISVFQNILDQQKRDIEEKISQLNLSLQTINFTQSTYIKLNSERVRDVEIQDFQNSLRDCFPDIGEERICEYQPTAAGTRTHRSAIYNQLFV